MKHFIFFFSKLKISHIIRLGRSQAKGKMKQLKPFKPTVRCDDSNNEQSTVIQPIRGAYIL